MPNQASYLVGSENRRYPRVTAASPSFGPALDGRIVWPNFETSALVDWSRGGLRAARPGLFEPRTGTHLDVELEFGGQKSFAVSVRPVWCTLDQVGLELGPLPAGGLHALDIYLEGALIGEKLRAIDSSHFARARDFDGWFQGPGQIHVFVTTGATTSAAEVKPKTEVKSKTEPLLKIEFHFAGDKRIFERGQPTGALDELALKALVILSRMDKLGLDVEDFARTLKYGAELF